MDGTNEDSVIQGRHNIPLIEPDVDTGNLLVVDSSPLEENELKTSLGVYLKVLAVRNVQVLINKLWELPTDRVEDAVVAKLPKGLTSIPRAKPVPKPRAPTRWEQYAKEKGIHKNQKDKLIWDDTEKTWRPRYGFKRADNMNKDWLVEVPENADPNTNVFQEKATKKKERVAKNEYQRLRNIARGQKIKLPSNALVQEDRPNRKQLLQVLQHAKKSTASVGKFEESLADKKQPKERGKKQKFQSNFGDLNEERNKYMKIFENLHKKTPKLDVTQAVNLHNQEHPKNGTSTARKDGAKKSKSFIKKKQQRQQKNKPKGHQKKGKKQ